ncbi:type I polyketide synthase [Nocardioides gilvus]|uniref:type I polyketide synthase n=1 Tax=Nocardioides gilvus TaxID=1735589 RepID=UPI000D74085D|nr:type I polyketide synthase [Nocardioides gilvus]
MTDQLNDHSGPRPDDIAIVGVAGVFPGARDAATFWNNIVDGVDSITDSPAERWDPVFFDPDAKSADRFYTRRGGFVDDVATFDPLTFGIMPVAMESIEPDQMLALATAAACLADAGDVHEDIDPERVAVVLGRGGYLGDGIARLDQRVRTAQQVVEVLRSVVPGITEAELERVKEQFQDSLGPERPEGAIGLVPNLAASRVANRFDFQGPAYTVDAACASSLIAVEQACDLLRSGRSDLVLAGGVHHCHDLTLWSVFSQLRALSPSGGIRPFSEAADGVLIGEGTGIMALRRLADAQRDGDRVYAVVRGTGVSSDGKASSPMSPLSSGQVQAVEAAWRAAGLNPADVGLIEAHGTATPLGDRTELATLATVFGDHDPTSGSRSRAVLGSVKSNIGHAMPAAGAAGMIKAALALHHRVLPPTLHAEEPHADLDATRFRLISKAEPWESDGERLAGVNAFGFGGINAHVVLSEAPDATDATTPAGGHHERSSERTAGMTADTTPAGGHHERSSERTSAMTSAVGQAYEPDEEVVLLAGRDADDLLAQLDALTASGRTATTAVPPANAGPARLAIVSPNERRLTLARKVLARGTAFRGRNDVWFDPSGLLRDGEICFLFPGVEPEFNPQVDEVAALLGIPWTSTASPTDGVQGQGIGITEVGHFLADALSAVGVRPDQIAGHSLGEWTGHVVSGMIPFEHVHTMLAGLKPGAMEFPDVVFVALGCGVEAATEIIDGVSDAHISHDNCPHQSIVCAPQSSVPAVLARAKERKVMAQEMPFRSGFHSPLFAPYVDGLLELFRTLPMSPATVPLWSATTLEPYPDDQESINALATRHLLEPVRFRELTLKLYERGVRAFVQVGSGSLNGFLDDTLREHDVLTVSALSAPGARVAHSSVGQLRRVAVALWSAGRDVDLAPLGHGQRPDAESPREGVRPAPRGGMSVRMGSPLIRDLTPLTGARAAVATSGRHGERSSQQPASMTSPAVTPPSAAVASSGFASEFQALVRDATLAAQEVTEAATRSVARHRERSPQQPAPRTSQAGAAQAGTPQQPAAVTSQPAPPAPTAAQVSQSSPLTPVANESETLLELSVAAQPWWGDHAFYPQPPGWECLEDRFPLVPLTALIEMLADEAHKLLPGGVVVSVEQVRAFKWLAVEPAAAVTVRATLDVEASAAAGEGTYLVKSSIEGHARAVIRLAASHPEAPAPRATPVHGEIPRIWTVEEIYPGGHLFHGPAYQGISSIEAFGTDGAAGHLETKPFPGSLLDNAGQIFGIWVAARAEKDRLVLPTSVDAFTFFGPHPEPGTQVRCVVNCTALEDTHVRADLELTVDGRVWCRIEGWEDRRFQSDDRLFTMLREPGDHLLAVPQAGGWQLVIEGWPDSASREVVMRRFLGQRERDLHLALNPRAQRTRLLGRIAVKDAVRARLFDAGHPAVWPVQVDVHNDEAGRPSVRLAGLAGDHVGSTPGDLRVSLAHTLGGRGAPPVGIGVAIAADGVDVGIDLERVTERADTFASVAMTEAEQRLFAQVFGHLSGRDRDRELTRWWTAKEAVAKAAGTGLQGRPRDFEVIDVRHPGSPLHSGHDGPDLQIRERWVATASIHPPTTPSSTTQSSTAQPPAASVTSTTHTASPDVAALEEYVVAWTDLDPRHG